MVRPPGSPPSILACRRDFALSETLRGLSLVLERFGSEGERNPAMWKKHFYWTVALLLLSSFQVRAGEGSPGDDDSVWVEGESAFAKKVNPHPWYSDAVRKDQMSGGAWLSHFSDAADGSA